MSTAEAVKAEEFGIEPTTAKELVSGLTTTLAEREILKKAYLEVLKLEVTESNLHIFKDLRLKIVKNRTKGLEVWRENKKRFFLTGGNFVDATAKMYKDENSDWEAKLLKAEKTFEDIETARLEALQKERVEMISPYLEEAEERDYTKFDEYEFKAIFDLKVKKFNEAEALRKEEEIKLERLKKEEEIKLKSLKDAADKLKKEVEKKEALRKVRNEELKPYTSFIGDYNEVLEASEKDYKIFLKGIKKSAEDKTKLDAQEAKLKLEEDAKVEAERLKQVAILEAEKAKTDALAKKLKEKEEADKKVIAGRLAKEVADKKVAEKLAKAPTKEQLTAWVNEFSIEIPPSHLLNDDTALLIKAKFDGFKKWSLTQIENI